MISDPNVIDSGFLNVGILIRYQSAIKLIL